MEKTPCNCNYCSFFPSAFFLRFYSVFFIISTIKHGLAIKETEEKPRGSFNQIDTRNSTAVAFAVLWPRFFSR